MLNKIKKGSLLFGGFLSLLLTTNCQNLNKQENLKQSIQKQSNNSLVAICGNRKKSTINATSDFSVPLYFNGDWKSMLDDHPEIDCAIFINFCSLSTACISKRLVFLRSATSVLYLDLFFVNASAIINEDQPHPNSRTVKRLFKIIKRCNLYKSSNSGRYGSSI